MRPSRLALVVPLLVLLFGCGGNSTEPPPDPIIEPETPQTVLLKLEKSWEFQDLPLYSQVLTEDFRFTFSAASDPELVDRYPNWGRDDELESMRHLFEGFTNSVGQQIPAAKRVDFTLSGVQYGPDFSHADSTAHYFRIVVATLDGLIEVPGFPDPTEYSISSRHEFYVVRGDAAVLSGDAVADSTHWYLRRWDDFAPYLSGLGKGPVINPSRSHSIGSIKAFYRN